MAAEENNRLGAPPSPNDEKALRRALAEQLKMYEPLLKYLQEAGYERSKSYAQFVEELNYLIPDLSFLGALQQLEFFQVLLSLNLLMEDVRNVKNTADILKYVFENFAKDKKYDLAKFVEDTGNSLKEIKEATEKGPKLTLDEIKDALNEEFKKFDDKFETRLKTQENLLTSVNRRQDSWEQIRAGLVRDYAASFRKVNHLVEDIPDEWAEIAKLIVDLIEEKVVEEVAIRIVGSSYSRWDNTSSYYPTIVFLFRETGAGNRPRSSQIKIRWRKDPHKIEDKDIVELKSLIQAAMPVTYNHGTVRCNYVQNDKTWKTTIFADTENDGVSVLTKLCGILTEPIDRQQFSFTHAQRRTTVTRRTTPLDGITPEYIDYKLKFPVELYRAVVLINGLRKPIKLYQKPKEEGV